MTLADVKQLKEVDQFHTINTIICCFDSTDNYIHYNETNEVINEFINQQDFEDAVMQSNSYNFEDKYFIHYEYKKLISSNNLLDLVDLKALEFLLNEYKEQIQELQII